MKRSLSLLGKKLSVLCLVVLPGTALAQDPWRYFPLDPGNVWEFRREMVFDPARCRIAVLGREGNMVRVRYECFTFLPEGRLFFVGPTEVRLRDRGDEIDIELPGEGLVPYHRFEEESFIHRDVERCNDNWVVTVRALQQPVKVPAGVFDECLLFVYRDCAAGTCCTHLRHTDEVWCKDVGLVLWSIQPDEGGLLTWSLLSFESLETRAFLRGDANADGTHDISDAVGTLGHLFLGEGAIPCEEAADANDDGKVNITDAVFTLNVLFKEPGLEIPPPGAETCDFDPSEDGLGCASYPPCA